LSLEGEERRRVLPQRPITWIDRIWNYFASVKIAMVYIGLIAVTAIIGTLIPQENTIPSVDPATFYAGKFGRFGSFMFNAGLTRMYSSWWFLCLLLLLAISLIICSWERIVPLYKSLTHQTVKKSIQWIRQRQLYYGMSDSTDEDMERLNSSLSGRHYKVSRKDGALLAEKGRFSRFGPYIIHIGLLLVIAAAFSRLLPGWFFNADLIIDNGQTMAVPHTPFSIRNNKFMMEQYPDGRAKMYSTDATLFDNGKPAVSNTITVNHPLKYKNVLFFQESFTTPRFQSAVVTLSKDSKHSIGNFSLDLTHLRSTYHVGAYTVSTINYFPDFSVEGSAPVTVSPEPQKPVFIFEVKGPGITKPQPQWFVLFMPVMSSFLSKDAPLQFGVNAVQMTQSTVLRVHKDVTVPLIYFGALVVLAGLATTFYFQHRRWWARLEDGVLHIGCHTNKNWFAIKKDFEVVMMGLGVNERQEQGSDRT